MPKSNHYILKYGDWKFGQGNTSVRTLPQPPKEKRKCISTSARTIKKIKNKKFRVCADATSIRADGINKIK
jgi:hypothetical protein